MKVGKRWKWKINKLIQLLDNSNQTIISKIKDYKKETEILTNLLLQIMPLVKNQFSLEDYHSKDFKNINKGKFIINKENYILMLLCLIFYIKWFLKTQYFNRKFTI